MTDPSPEASDRNQRAGSPEETGERLLPDLQPGELVLAEHLARYRLAAHLASGRRVLDAACGEGYGTAVLAAAGAAAAVGVDAHEATVTRAADRYGLEFITADVARLPLDDDAFDLVVCFETVEHVSDPEAVLGELERVLAPGGLLLISTPNSLEYRVENEFHVREFSHVEFLDLLRSRFASVRPLYQQNWLASAILEEHGLREDGGESALQVDVRKVAGVSPGRELYTLALCGDRSDEQLSQVAVLADVHEARELAERLAECERTAHRWHDAYQESLRTHRWMTATLSWRLTRPFRAPARLWSRWRGR